MNPNKIKQPYTAEHIRAYLSGKMSDAEMHALEKAALGDPLLADAIEGYQLADQHNPYPSLDALKKNIATQATGNPGWTRQRYMRMAAALALVALLAVSGYLLLDRQENKSAETSIAENRVPNNTPVISSAETNTDSATLRIAAKEAEKPGEKTGANVPVIKPSAPETTPVQKDAAVPAQENAMSNAVAQSADHESKTVVTETPALTYPADASKENTPQAQGVTAKGETLRPSEQEDRNAVTVTTAKQHKKENAARTELTQNPTVQPGELNLPAPLMGRAAYEQYLSKSISLTQEIREKYRGQSVKLGFVVRRNGKITDIRVLESVSPECDAEAIRLLKAGPAWGTGDSSSGKGNLTVNF